MVSEGELLAQGYHDEQQRKIKQLLARAERLSDALATALRVAGTITAEVVEGQAVFRCRYCGGEGRAWNREPVPHADWCPVAVLGDTDPDRLVAAMKAREEGQILTE